MYSSSSGSSSSPESFIRHSIPKSYKFLEVLGEGGFGQVVKCVRRGTEHTVAIKIPRNYSDLHHEASMLKTLMIHKLDENNVIKFYGECFMNSRMSLILEVLDISLLDYILNAKHNMRLADIKTVIQQLATAFDALKNISVIHTDVKPENIMMVDHVRQPFRVKLIDFGLAIFRSQAKQGRIHQSPYYRAPEIILGLPFSEAIDIWSLGCVMAVMIFGFLLFPASNNYDALRFIIDLLGSPPDHLLDAGRHSRKFFKKTDSNQWIFMTQEEYWELRNHSSDYRCYKFRSLDKMKKIHLEKINKTKAKERRECIELLKKMLNLDGNQRITPSGILNHPFITKSYLNSSSNLNSCDQPLESAAAQPSTCHTHTTPKQTKQETKDDDSPHSAATPSTTIDSTRIYSDEMDLSPTTDDNEDKKKKRKKKRNCFTCFISWMRKKIFTS